MGDGEFAGNEGMVDWDLDQGQRAGPGGKETVGFAAESAGCYEFFKRMVPGCGIKVADEEGVLWLFLNELGEPSELGIAFASGVAGHGREWMSCENSKWTLIDHDFNFERREIEVSKRERPPVKEWESAVNCHAEAVRSRFAEGMRVACLEFSESLFPFGGELTNRNEVSVLLADPSERGGVLCV